MAIYHFNTQPISRGQGRSIIACAAYRSGSEIEDVRLGKIFNYSNKKDVVHSIMLLPSGAPDWMRDRSLLWNHIEKIEKRKDARLAREIQFSLPRELSEAQNIELAKDFVQKYFVDEGMVADVAVHYGEDANGESQPHVHALLTTRVLTEAGFGEKNTEWNKKEKLLEWRESWAECANEFLARHDIDQRIDHRSNADREIDLAPQKKIGSVLSKSRSERLEEHQRIAQANGEKLLAEPEIALRALTQQQSTFTHHDLAKFVNRHTADAEQFQEVYDRLLAHEQLVLLGKDAQGRDRYSTQEMIDVEMALRGEAIGLREQKAHAVDESVVERVIHRSTLSDEQEIALRGLVQPEGLSCVLGYAGTGKSYLLGAAREAWEESGYRVLGVSLSGIAAQNLEHSSGIESRTVASLRYRLALGTEHLSNKDVLVIDEAGMLGSRAMESLLSQAQAGGAKVVCVGDWQQLQAIEAGAAFRLLAQEAPVLELKGVRRQQEAWQKEATVELAQGNVKAALARYEAHDLVHWYKTQEEAKHALITEWNDTRHAHPEATQLILAYTKKDVRDLNELARSHKQRDGELGESATFMTEQGKREFAAGDRLYFLRRNDDLTVINGSLGAIQQVDVLRGTLTVALDDDGKGKRTVTVDTAAYRDLDHGYAATIHKSQGATVDRAYLLASKNLDAHATYVGLTRHRQSVSLYSSQEAFPEPWQMAYNLNRDRAKDTTLDYRNEPSIERQANTNTVTEKRPLEERLASSAEIIKQHLSDREAGKASDKSCRLAEENAFKLIHNKNRFPSIEKINPELAGYLTKLADFFEQRQGKKLFRSLRSLEAREVDYERYAEQMTEYMQDLKEGKISPEKQDKTEKGFYQLAQSPSAMDKLRSADPQLANQVESLARNYQLRHGLTPSHSKAADRGYDIEIPLSRGFEREMDIEH